MKKIHILTLFFLLSFNFAALAQDNTSENTNTESATNVERRFRASAHIGFNASQINDDGLFGYNKFGLFADVLGHVIIKENRYLTTGITYAQRGSATSFFSPNQYIKLDYVEVPLIFNFCDWKNDAGFYHAHFGLGVIYGRLTKFTSNVKFLEGEDAFFKTDNVGWVADAMFYVNKNYSFGVRYNRGINRVYENKNLRMLEHWISFKTGFSF